MSYNPLYPTPTQLSQLCTKPFDPLSPLWRQVIIIGPLNCLVPKGLWRKPLSHQVCVECTSIRLFKISVNRITGWSVDRNIACLCNGQCVGVYMSYLITRIYIAIVKLVLLYKTYYISVWSHLKCVSFKASSHQRFMGRQDHCREEL